MTISQNQIQLDTAYIRKAISSTHMTMEDAESVVPWLRSAVEEIESLRSDNNRLTKEVEYQVKRNDEYRESERSLLDKLQQAEQERDKNRAYVDTVNHDSEQVAIKATYQQIEIDKLVGANTAMREELEWYARTDYGDRAKLLLSRYPKEGDTQ